MRNVLNTLVETGASMLKAQHPEFEMWSQGVHSRAGVSCSDCHMPYKRVGAMKVSDHHVRSPMLNINNACQTCHNRPEADILAQVEDIQKRHKELTEIQGFWSKKAKDKGILSEKDLERYLAE